MIWSGQFSDYKLQCGAEIIDVHKMILAARSPFFVELMMKNPQHCVITNIDMETLRLLDDETVFFIPPLILRFIFHQK